MAGFLDSEDSLDPGNDFMGTGVGRFVEIDDSVLQVVFKGPFKGSGACGDWSIVVGENVHFMVVFEEEGPFGAVKGGILIGRLDQKLLLSVDLFFYFLLDKLFTFLLIFCHALLNKNYGK